MRGSSESVKPQKFSWPILTRFSVIFRGVLVLLVPVLYLAILGGTAWFLVTTTLQTFEQWALEPGWGAKNIGIGVGLLAGSATWVWFFKPFWMKPEKPVSKLEMHAAAQPEWMETVLLAVKQANAPKPVEICLDSGNEVRLEPVSGVLSGLMHKHRLIVGAALVGVCSEGQFTAELVSALGRSPSGLSGRCYWLIEWVMKWLGRAVSGAHQQKLDMGPNLGYKGLAKRKKSWWQQPAVMKLASGYEWLTRRPIWMMLVLARMVTRPAMDQIELVCDRAGVKMLGGEGMAELLLKKERLRLASKVVDEKLQEGIEAGRMPDNVVLQTVKEAALLGEVTEIKDAGIEKRRLWAQKKGGVAMLNEGGAASLLVRRFQEICRQLTQTRYQQDLGLSLNQIRLVAVGEGTRRKVDDGALGDIQRYFEGLAHPLRPMCGLVEESDSTPTEAEMREQVALSRRMMGERGEQVRAAQKEWTMAWQRCRDLEMAHAFALAGMPMDPRQYGLRSHDAAVYREEIERQMITMEHADDSLRAIEADMEKQLAASLGLMMNRPPDSCAGELRAMAEELPRWGMAFGVLSMRVPVLWEMRNLAFALESLGLDARVDGFQHADAGNELEEQGRALDYLIPRIRQCMSRMLADLDPVDSPMRPGMSMVQWLTEGLTFPGWETRVESVVSGNAAMKVLDRFEEVYQTAFAWICRASEASQAAWGGEKATASCERPILLHFAGCEPESKSQEPALAGV